ncbi:hypothetical protein [uncultured Brevibacillus sp.]|uniref:hypothetical protein n=1 Tax=uncultured Brevibacillus sp. TaxID=169970 RepID=UPI0025986DF6|nr:hypothetical protein [uncultured Brevibacillus sp.]
MMETIEKVLYQGLLIPGQKQKSPLGSFASLAATLQRVHSMTKKQVALGSMSFSKVMHAKKAANMIDSLPRYNPAFFTSPKAIYE